MSTEAILNLGSDQMANQYVVLFPSGIPGGGDKDQVSLRIQGSFAPPAVSYATYTIDYRGLTIQKVSTKEETSKELNLEIRLDQQWEIYDSLSKWLYMVFDPETHIAMPDEAIRTNIVMQAYGRDDTIAKSLTFRGVIIKSLEVSAFEVGSSEPSTLTVGFTFYNMTAE